MRTTKFKASEIGPIPVEWEVKHIGEIAAVGRGRVISQIEIQKAKTRKYPVYSSQTSNNGEMGCIDTYDFDGEYVTWTTDGANAGRVFYRNGKFNCTNICGVLNITSEFPRYIAFALNTRTAEYVSSNLANPKLMNGVMKEIAIPIPPLSEQRRIATALSDADAWIESLEKLIEKKKLVKQGAMQALLSGKTRLPGFSGEWTREAIGDEFDFLRTNTLARACLGDNGSIADVHYGDVLVRYGNILDFSTETPPFIEGRFESRSIGDFLQDGDLVMADTAEDETVGKAVEIQNLGQRHAVAGLHTVACRPKHPFAPRWLGHFVNSPTFHNQLLPLISGTKVSSISKENLKTVFVLRPPPAEQRAIASVLSDMDAELAALSREKAKAEQIKQGMMQELLTGKTRLKGEKNGNPTRASESQH